MKHMDFRYELAKLTPRLRDNYPGKIYVFGTGQHWRDIHQWYLDVVNVDLVDYIFAFVDNDREKQGLVYMGHPVISASEMDLENAVVLISSSAYHYEISQQLQSLGLVYSNSFFTAAYFTLILNRFVYAETARFNNCVKGGRCFIIGNGPSLRIEDLNVLHQNGEMCFGVNRIINIFDKTTWRPSYYFAHDSLIIPDSNTLNQMKIPVFMSFGNAKQDFFNEQTFYYEIDNSPLYYDYPYRPKFSRNIERMYIGGSIIYPAIQAAVSMGYDEIYLLGVDHVCDTEVLYDGTIVKNNVERHFYQDSQLIMASAIDILNSSLKFAREYCDKHGIRIRNATRGGKLEIFERINFDSL